MRLLLVEDDSSLADALQPILEAAGYAVDRSDDGEDALYLGETEEYDLVILDLGLPRINGVKVLGGWRRAGRTMPVLILTARDTWREKVLGLKAGADDYLTKPFHPEELLARLGALLRRAHGRAASEIVSQTFALDEERQCAVCTDGTRTELTGTEFRLLRYFMLNPGKPLSKTRLTEHVYNQPFSGHYYWVRFDDGRVLRSRSLWDHPFEIAALSSGGTALHLHDGPQGQRLLLWRAGYEKQGEGFTVAVAEDLTPLLQALRRLLWVGIGLSLVGALTLLFVQRWLLRRGFRQVSAVRADVRRLEAGEIDRLREDVPAEVQPLVRELNQFIDAWRRHLQRSRNALGNLAHALKSPLNLILLHHSETPGDPVSEQALRMRGLIDRELRRARIAGDSSPGRRFRPHEDVADLTAGMRTLYGGRSLEISADVNTPECLPFDQEDMLELIGNLLDNAAKWAMHRVRLRLDWNDSLQILVEDDGPGVDPGTAEVISTRGSRLDETTTGQWFGLSIVGEIVRLHGGQVRFGRSESLGGFASSVELPGMTAR